MVQQTQENFERGTYKELNGVNLDKLNEMVSNVKANKSLGAFKFRLTNEWISAATNRSTIKPFFGTGKEFTERDKKFVLEADAPEILLGKDKAADPVEYLLHALCSCMTTTIAYHSAAKGISINKLSSSFEGDLDLQGFLGLSDSVKKGYKEIRVVFNVDTTAKESDLRELIKFSPVYEMVSAGVPVKVDFKINKPILS